MTDTPTHQPSWPLRYGSVCSGIEAATAAWEPLGFHAQWFSEIEPFPSAVLAHRYPDVPNHGDMTKFKEWPNQNDPTQQIDILVGGTPCQSFSVAGLRKGLDDPRGSLMLTYLAIAERYRPRWVVWENVPGVLSSNNGRDFGTFLGALGELGYGYGYRVLDARHFGVPQRRRRVFVVGYLGDWRRAAAVLFEQDGLRGDTATSGEAGEDAAANAARGADKGSHWDDPVNPHPSLTQTNKGTGGIGASNQELFSQRGGGLVASDGRAVFGNVENGQSATLSSREHKGLSCGRDGLTSAAVLAFPTEMSGTQVASTENQSPALSVKHTTSVATQSAAPRRLTPIECERLMGFPDNFTQIPYRNKATEDCPTGHRYKALGNSMAVPVMRWLGEGIEMVEGLDWT